MNLVLHGLKTAYLITRGFLGRTTLISTPEVLYFKGITSNILYFRGSCL